MKNGQATKARIARAALTLFVEQGVTETTIRDIAGRAGVAEGTLYRHYAGKDELAWELFVSHYTELARQLQELQAREHAMAAKIRVMVRHFCTFFDRDAVLFSYLLLAQHGHLKRVTPEMPNPVDVVQRVIWQGMLTGELPAGDAAAATAMVMGIVLQVAVFKIYGRLPASLTGMAETLTTACLRVLQGRVPL